jgi:predicted RNase H-like HicB family nuclease
VEQPQREEQPIRAEEARPAALSAGSAEGEALERLEKVLELYSELLAEMERLRSRLSEKVS